MIFYLDKNSLAPLLMTWTLTAHSIFQSYTLPISVSHSPFPKLSKVRQVSLPIIHFLWFFATSLSALKIEINK